MSKLNRKAEKCTSKTTMFKWVVLIVATLSMGVGAVFAFNIPGLGKNEAVKPVNGVVTISLARVSDGKAHYYRIADGGKEIDFFVVKGPDGALHTAFDACDVCFQEKKGYVQQGDFMICKNCNKKFAINMIGRMSSAGCNPSHLEHAEDGRNIIIKFADLKTGARFF